MIIVISQHHSPPALCNPTPTDKILSATKALPTTATADKRRRSLLQDVCHDRQLALEILTFTWEVYLKFEMSYIVAKD